MIDQGVDNATGLHVREASGGEANKERSTFNRNREDTGRGTESPTTAQDKTWSGGRGCRLRTV